VHLPNDVCTAVLSHCLLCLLLDAGYFERAKAVIAKYESGARYNGYVSLDDKVASYFQGNYARLRASQEEV